MKNLPTDQPMNRQGHRGITLPIREREREKVRGPRNYLMLGEYLDVVLHGVVLRLLRDQEPWHINIFFCISP